MGLKSLLYCAFEQKAKNKNICAYLIHLYGLVGGEKMDTYSSKES